MKKILRLALAAILFAAGTVSARLLEPASMPQDIKGTSPHKPEAAVYYLAELVKEGRMTEEEAERTEVYMIFRNARRMQDLQDVEGLSEEDRRAYMKKKRELRGNPLVEYANRCGFTLERAKELMDLMHDSDKGTSYYGKARHHG